MFQNYCVNKAEFLNDNKIVYNPFEFEANTSGGAYHPSLSAQKKWGEMLANYITGLNIK